MKIYVISSPRFGLSEFERFLSDEALEWRRTEGATAAEEIVEASGRICYLSFGKQQAPRSNGEYIFNLIDKGHESVFEHVSWTFMITGVSRAFTHQLVRHRAGFSFSQLSQQYHDESNAQFVPPKLLEQNESAFRVWLDSVENARRSYKALLKAAEDLASRIAGHSSKELQRAIRSAARSVLPNATETKIMVTANARALRHFLKIRGSVVGDLEMRFVCAELLKILKREAPSVFQDFDLRDHEDGFPIIVQFQIQKVDVRS